MTVNDVNSNDGEAALRKGFNPGIQGGGVKD
jgi:hypothetical protein